MNVESIFGKVTILAIYLHVSKMLKSVRDMVFAIKLAFIYVLFFCLSLCGIVNNCQCHFHREALSTLHNACKHNAWRKRKKHNSSYQHYRWRETHTGEFISHVQGKNNMYVIAAWEPRSHTVMNDFWLTVTVNTSGRIPEYQLYYQVIKWSLFFFTCFFLSLC